MVIVVGSLEQVREHFAGQMRKPGCQVRWLSPSSLPPFPSSWTTWAAHSRVQVGHLSLGNNFSPYSVGCGDNGTACGLLSDVNWAKEG